MRSLMQFYPGDQFMLLVVTVIGQVALIVFLGLILTRFPTPPFGRNSFVNLAGDAGVHVVDAAYGVRVRHRRSRASQAAIVGARRAGIGTAAAHERCSRPRRAGW